MTAAERAERLRQMSKTAWIRADRLTMEAGADALERCAVLEHALISVQACGSWEAAYDIARAALTAPAGKHVHRWRPYAKERGRVTSTCACGAARSTTKPSGGG